MLMCIKKHIYAPCHRQASNAWYAGALAGASWANVSTVLVVIAEQIPYSTHLRIAVLVLFYVGVLPAIYMSHRVYTKLYVRLDGSKSPRDEFAQLHATSGDALPGQDGQNGQEQGRDGHGVEQSSMRPDWWGRVQVRLQLAQLRIAQFSGGEAEDFDTACYQMEQADTAPYGMPLVWACQGGHTAVVERLVARPDIEVNTQNNDGWTALLKASAWGHKNVVERLLARPDIEVNTQGIDGHTALMRASLNGQKDVVERLLARPDIEVNTQGNDGHTALMRASANGHKDVVERLLARPDIEVNTQDNDGWTALRLASLE